MKIYILIILILNQSLHILGHEDHEDSALESTSETYLVKFQMPGVRAEKDDEYMCTYWNLPDKDLYFVEFGALLDVGTVHHMLLYGCADSHETKSVQKNCFGPCSGGRVMYAWAKNAPPTKVPKDVAFHVGTHTDIKTLALQVHYRFPMKGDDPLDHSGIQISVSQTSPRYKAGVFLLAANSFVIPARQQKASTDVSCTFNSAVTLHPFAFRTHSHDLGRVIAGYVVKKNSQWNLIGKGNPQWPQAFYPVNSGVTIEQGDVMVARCTYNASGRDVDTRIGEGHNDEMCNFYTMYYSSAGDPAYVCAGNRLPALTAQMPSYADQLLPPNPLLDEAPHGHHHGGMKSEESSELESEEESQELVVDESWPSFNTSLLSFGQISGVAVDTKNNVHMFHRGSRVWDQWSFDLDDNYQFRADGPIRAKTIVELDSMTGQIVNEWGDNMFYMPHGLHIDKEGRFWITDVALHQVMKFDKPGSKPSLVLGEAFKPGRDSSHFCKPTDVAVLDSGEFFVADGYCNARIVKFSKDGTYITEFGTPTSDGAVGGVHQITPLVVPHSLTLVKRLDAQDEVCTADRQNARIMCYTITGTFTRSIQLNEFKPALFAIVYSYTGLMYTITGSTGKSSSGNLLGSVVNLTTSSLVATFKPHDKGFYHPHDIAISSNGSCVYVVEIGPNRIWKFHHKNSSNHLSVKKALLHHHHPISSSDDDGEEEGAGSSYWSIIGEGGLSDTWQMSIVVISLLVVPLTLILIVTVCVRIKKKGCSCCNSDSKKNRRFNPGNLLNRHNGFSLLSTMDNYRDNIDELTNPELAPLNSDESEVEEYTGPTHQQKA